MANYNTFIVVDCKNRKTVMSTSSARKAAKLLSVGLRVDVWNNNVKTETVYSKTKDRLAPYIAAEKQYIREKQEAARLRNQMRQQKRAARMCCA